MTKVCEKKVRSIGSCSGSKNIRYVVLGLAILLRFHPITGFLEFFFVFSHRDL